MSRPVLDLQYADEFSNNYDLKQMAVGCRPMLCKHNSKKQMNLAREKVLNNK